MRTAYAIGLAAFLAASPAMAQVVISTDNDAARHDQRAQQDRMDAHHDQAEAQRDAAMGNYRGAAHEQNEARDEWRDSQHQQHDADHDSNGVSVQFGH